MRVVYVLDTLAASGTTDLVHHLAAGLDRSRFAPAVWALRSQVPGDPVPAEEREAEQRGAARFEALGVPAETLALDARLHLWPRIAPLAARLRRERVGVIHAHSRPADLWATWAGWRAGTPVRLYSRQATYGGMPLANRARYALTARAASRVVAVSEAVRDHLCAREGVPRRRIELIHDGIDLDGLARVAPAEATRRRLGLAPDTPLIGTVAALTPRKNVAALLAAAPWVWDRVPDAHVAILGDGPERADLERRIAACGRVGQVHLLGFRPDYADWIAAFDVFVLPSLWEGFNLSLLTACALGRAVVATHLRSHREVLEPGVSGLLPTPARPVLEAETRAVDPRALGLAIAGLAADPTRRRRLGEAARLRALARFGARAMAARHEDLYERLLAGEGRRARSAPRRLASPASVQV